MRRSIFGLTLVLTIFISAVALAQLDLEEIITDDKPAATKAETPVMAEKQPQIAAATENTEASTSSSETAASQAPQPESTVVLPEDEPDETSPDVTSEIMPSADTDDFMVQYFNDIDNQAAEEAAAQAARSAAAELIRDEPTMITLPEEQQKLLKLSEKRRQQREQKRMQELEEQKRIEAEIAAQKQAEEEAKAEAEALKNPQIIANRKAEAEKKSREQMLSGHEKAPFGLYWGLSKEETETLGFQFKAAQLDNHQNVYVLTNPKQQQKTFEPVFVIFGNKNRLYSVYAKSVCTKDTPQAERVLRLYDQYYSALQKKYGNDKEYFQPYKHEEKAQMPAALKQTAEASSIPQTNSKTVMVEHPRGNDNFLQELQEEKASLYAIFGNKKMQITLTVEADKDGQSCIVLDYDNMEIQQKDDNETLNDLINEL